jgi:hypothetical protein
MTSTCTIDKDGNRIWRTADGELHRTDGPAIEYAYEYAGGYTAWYQHNKLHRDNAPAIEYINGDKYWYQNGKKHRTDGPAVSYINGGAFWYKHGKLHRVDGPAIEYVGRYELWVNGIALTHAEFASRILDEETALIWKMSGYCWPFDFGFDK